MACEVCAHCHGSLSHGETVVFKEEYSYHKNCHKCYVCSETDLRNAEVFKGVIFCSNCAQRIFQSSTNRRTKKDNLRSNDRELRGKTQRKRTSRKRRTGRMPVDRVIELAKMTGSPDSSTETYLEDLKNFSKTSATSKESFRRQRDEIENSSDTKTRTIATIKSSAEIGTTTLVTLQLLKQFNFSVMESGEQSPPPCQPPSSKRTERKKSSKKHGSDLRIAELGASTEIAHVALRHKSEMPVIIQSETHVKETSEESQSQSTTINQVSTDTSVGRKGWTISSESAIFESTCLVDRRIGSILRMPVQYFKYNILRRSSLISVLLDTQEDSYAVTNKVKLLFHDEINEHKTRGMRRLYSTINRRKMPHKLGWLTLNKLVTRYPGLFVRSNLERTDHKRCIHFKNSHSYRCMRTQVMRLAGPTKSDMDRATIDYECQDARSKSINIRYILLFLFTFGCVFFFQSYSSDIMIFISNDEIFRSLERHHYEVGVNDDRFTIKTDGCTIPSLKPFDETIKKFVEYPKNLKRCDNNNITLLDNNNTHIWINKQNIKYYNPIEDYIICCYKSFYRPTSVANVMSFKADERVKYKKYKYFEESIEVSDEFVRVTCQGDDNKVVNDKFFLFARKKKFDGDATEMLKNKSAYNVIVMGIDAVSRMNFHRTMPKTLAYLKEKGAVELQGYNKVGDNTFPNLVPMLMGMRDTELKSTCFPSRRSTFDNCPFVWEWYKQAGYYTALAEDSAWLGTFNYAQNGFIKTPTDYYTHTFFSEAEKHAANNKEYNAYLCLNENYLYQILLNYIDNLTSTLRGLKLFGFFWEISMSHDNLNYPMAMDNSYEKFLHRLYDSKYLDETILFLVSDHGIRWGDIRSTKQGRLEERLPFVFILAPPLFRENYKEAYSNLRLNAGRLTTPFDIHATLTDLLDLGALKNDRIISRSKAAYARRSISLFLPIPKNRTCKMADIEEHWCTCHNSHKVSIESAESLAASEYLIEYLNRLLRKHSQCAKLSLRKVIEVTEISVDTAVEKNMGWREFTLVVRASPGDGIFEATLRYDSGNFTVTGTVSRLNLYGNQSHCIHEYQLKLYCFCF